MTTKEKNRIVGFVLVVMMLVIAAIGYKFLVSQWTTIGPRVLGLPWCGFLAVVSGIALFVFVALIWSNGARSIFCHLDNSTLVCFVLASSAIWLLSNSASCLVVTWVSDWGVFWQVAVGLVVVLVVVIMLSALLWSIAEAWDVAADAEASLAELLGENRGSVTVQAGKVWCLEHRCRLHLERRFFVYLSGECRKVGHKVHRYPLSSEGAFQTGVCAAIGVIGPIPPQTNVDVIYVELWGYSMRPVHGADIDELEIHRGNMFDYDFVVQSVANTLHNDVGRPKPLKAVPVRLIGNPPLSEQTRRLLENTFAKVEQDPLHSGVIVNTV